MGRGCIVVEGHGELEAAGNLVNRLWRAAGRSLPWAHPIRWKNLHRETGLRTAVRHLAARPDTDALLILRDEDDGCPQSLAPEAAEWIRREPPAFPVALVLLHREFETLFLPCIDRMAGQPLRGPNGKVRPGLLPSARFEGNPESVRGVKEWLTGHFPPGRSQ